MSKYNRIILNIESVIGDSKALGLVDIVISQGKISDDGKQYCYATRLGEYMVSTARRSSNTHTFYVYTSQPKECEE